MLFEDLLCDACLYMMETSPHGVPLDDFCERCRKKIGFSVTVVTVEEVENQEDTP